MNFPKKFTAPRWVKVTSAAVLLAALSACASKGVAPTDAMAAANTAIAQADSLGASQNAPVELLAARDAYGKAEAAVRDEKFDEGRRLAEMAEADAQLAGRKSRAIKAKAVTAEISRGNDLLRQELERKTRP
jgi:hypothetical protein